MMNLDKERIALDREITFFHFGRARRKIRKCLKLVKRKGDQFFYFYFLAQEKILDEELKAALSYINKALKLRNNDGCSYNDKALILAELGQTDKALECFNMGIKKDRDCASLYHNKGWLLNSLGKHNHALICFNKALELDSGRPEALYSLADSYLALNQPKKAIKYFKAAFSAVKGKSSFVLKNIKHRLKTLEK